LSAEFWIAGRYDSTDRINAYYQDLTARVAALPGVTSAAVVEAGLPLQRGGNMPVQINGEYLHGTLDYRTITPSYFATLQIPLREGRLIDASDVGTGEPIVVVSESFAKRSSSPAPRSAACSGWVAHADHAPRGRRRR